MIGSVIEPHLSSIIDRFESQVHERITRIHRGAPSLRENKREKLAWAVGADIRPHDAPVHTNAVNPVSVEQELLMQRLKEKMEAKARTLRAIQAIQQSESVKPSLTEYKGS